MKQFKYIQSQKELAENIKLIRFRKGISQQKIATWLNVERSTYAYYETGKTQPDWQTLIKICEFYNIDLTDLLTKDGTLKKAAHFC